MHIRQQIREYILNGLTTEYGTDIQEISFDDPEVIQKDKFPNISIITNGETINSKIIGKPRRFESTLSLSVILIIRQRNNLQNTLDDLSIKLQKWFANDIYLGGLVFSSILNSVEFNQTDDAEKNIAGAKYDYLITYHYLENDPETSI